MRRKLVHRPDVVPVSLLLPRHQARHHALLLPRPHRARPARVRIYPPRASRPAPRAEARDMAGERGGRRAVPNRAMSFIVAFALTIITGERWRWALGR